MIRTRICLAASALAMGIALATPASAQEVCDVNGAPSGSATGGSALACGAGATANGAFSTAIGVTSVANGNYSTAIGDYAHALDYGATAVGTTAFADEFATAVGYFAESGYAATSLGTVAEATGDHSVAVGTYTDATALDSVAIGYRANATHSNSVAIGARTATTADNQVNVGGRTIGGVAAGVLATDAVNVGQLNAALGGMGSGLAAVQADVATLFEQNEKQDRKIGKANEGVAMALALDSPNVPAGSSFALSGGIGGFNGKHAVATAVSAAVSETASVSAGVGVGLSSTEVGYRAGFQIAF